MSGEWVPIETEPHSVMPPHDQYRHDSVSPEVFHAQLLEALDGVDLGAYDRRAVEWMAGWDLPRVAVVVSLFHRVRAAGEPSE